jgi:plasmid stabilization system protein ParE
MKLIYTEQFYLSLLEILEFYDINGFSREKQSEIANAIIAKTALLVEHPYLGGIEEYLSHLNLSHRRLIEGYCKIIYRVSESHIYIVDVFDSRQDPIKMKG